MSNVICESCKQGPATVHVTQAVAKQRKELHVCEACAGKNGPFKGNVSVRDFLAEDVTRTTVGDGKYTVEFNEKTGELRALRYGEPWRDLAGDNLVLCMLQRIHELEEKIAGYDPRD